MSSHRGLRDSPRPFSAKVSLSPLGMFSHHEQCIPTGEKHGSSPRDTGGHKAGETSSAHVQPAGTSGAATWAARGAPGVVPFCLFSLLHVHHKHSHVTRTVIIVIGA